MTVSFLVLLLSVLTPLLAAGAGVPIITNPSSPANGLETLQLEEMWRVGGIDDEDTVLGQVVRIVGDDSGSIYVLDAQLQQAFVYNETGELQHTLFGPGEGPGEVRRACDLTLMSDGSVAAVNRFPGGLVMVSPAGVPAGSLKLSVPGRGFSSAVYRGGNLVVAETANVTNEDGTHIVQSILGSLQPDGERIAIYLQSDRHVDYQNDFVFNERKALIDYLYSFDVGPDGSVYALSDADRYAISVFSPGGELTRVIQREFEVQSRTNAELARLKALTERRFRTFPFGIRYVFAECEAVIPWYFRGLKVMDDGSLWVRHCQSGESKSDTGALVVFDVFDKAGIYDRQVTVSVPGRAANDGVFMLENNRVIVVHGFVDSMVSNVGGGRGEMGDEGAEPDPVEIVCYRIIGSKGWK